MNKKEVLRKQHFNKIAYQRDEDILAKKIIELATQSSSWSSLKVKKKKYKKTILLHNAAIYFLRNIQI